VGSRWLQQLYDYFAPVRQEAEAQGHSEEAIDTAIDAAVRAARQRSPSLLSSAGA
jgi:hypothetical protein